MFFFEQKTAYEMRISDWSSDVCSSDLLVERDVRMRPQAAVEHADLLEVRQHRERGVGAVAVAQGLEVRVHAAVQVDARLLGLDAATHVAEVGLEVERVVGTLLCPRLAPDRKSVVEGKSGRVRGNLGG